MLVLNENKLIFPQASIGAYWIQQAWNRPARPFDQAQGKVRLVSH